MPFWFVPVAEASPVQNKILAIAPKVTSFLSFVSSGYIILDVVNMYRRGRRAQVKTYHRILLGMSICDALASFAWFFTTWPIPYDVFPAYGASGTQATCTAQGFFTQFSIASVFYNGSLALYYCLVVRFGWSDRRITEAHVERWMHLSALGAGLGTSTTCVMMGLFNPVGWDCWIGSAPLGCQESWLNNGETACVRGDNATLYQWLFFYLPLWIIIFLVSIAMYMVYSAYKEQAKTAGKWQQENEALESLKISEEATCAAATLQVEPAAEEAPNQQNRQASTTTTTTTTTQYLKPLQSTVDRVKNPMSRRDPRCSTSMELRRQLLATQALLYVGAFYVVWFFPTISRIQEVSMDVVYYHWVLLSAIFVPSQGTNTHTHTKRLRTKKYKSENRTKSYSVVKLCLLVCFYGSFPPCLASCRFAVTTGPYTALILFALLFPNLATGLLNVYVYLRPRYMNQRRQREMARRLPKSRGGHSTSTGTGYNFNQSTNASHSHSHQDAPGHPTIGDTENMQNHDKNSNSCESLQDSIVSWKSSESRAVDVDHTNDSTTVDKIEDTDMARKEADDSRTFKDKTRHLETTEYSGGDDTPTNTTTTDCTIECQLADVIPDQIADVDTDDNDSVNDMVDTITANDEDKIVEAPLDKAIV
jgi:hypothetical protein